MAGQILGDRIRVAAAAVSVHLAARILAASQLRDGSHPFSATL